MHGTIHPQCIKLVLQTFWRFPGRVDQNQYAQITLPAALLQMVMVHVPEIAGKGRWGRLGVGEATPALDALVAEEQTDDVVGGPWHRRATDWTNNLNTGSSDNTTGAAILARAFGLRPGVRALRQSPKGTGLANCSVAVGVGQFEWDGSVCR
ncbi:MAG TPA: hypothetical protein VII06_21865 [Chloroflexota bacterium]